MSCLDKIASRLQMTSRAAVVFPLYESTILSASAPSQIGVYFLAPHYFTYKVIGQPQGRGCGRTWRVTPLRFDVQISSR